MVLNYLFQFLGPQVVFQFLFFQISSLVAIPIGIVSSAMGVKVCVITAGIKKYMSVIKKKRKKRDKVLLAENKYYRSLNLTHISHDEFVSVNNIFKEYDDIKEATKNPQIIKKYV